MAKTILVVEDDESIREGICEFLEMENYKVLVASNGQEAFGLLNQATSLPDIILLDIMMPVMDGYQFREGQRASEKFNRIPVVVFTADRLDPEKTKRLSVQAVLKKPVDLELLLDTLRTVGLGA